MADLSEIIQGRRSVRRYEDRDIPDDLLNSVLEAVRWAPSWANTQCWEIVVVKDQAIKEQLEGVIAPKNPATKAISRAPVVIAVVGKMGVSGYYKDVVTTRFGDWFMYDLGLATQNLCLQAHALGLGTVIVGLFDQEKAEKILNIPEGFQLVTLIPMGFPAKTGPAPKRKEVKEFAHTDTF